MSSPTQESVGGTSSYGTPEDHSTQEWSSEIDFDERPPPRHGAPCTAVAADAASRRPSEPTLLVKRPIRVSHSSSVTIAPPAREGGSKRRKTEVAQQDLCCFCAVGATCSSRNCSCAKAGRPCRSCDPGECGRCSNTMETLNRVICSENTRRVSSIAARFPERVGRPPWPPIPLHSVELAPDNDNKGLMGPGLNNPPDGDEPHDDNPVDGGSTLSASPLTNDPVGDDDDDDASTFARGSTAAGSDATTASATALDRPVDGSDALPASTTALDLPVDGSNAEREGESWAAGATGDDENPLGDGAGGDFSIPPM